MKHKLVTERLVYVLRLEDNGYFIGQIEVEELPQITTLYQNSSLTWNRQRRALGLNEALSLGSCTFAEARQKENEVTVQYMSLYGISNVRGGDFTASRDSTVLKQWMAYDEEGLWDLNQAGQ
ncbi:hypothetical protein ACFSR7_05875 [Cohnella sp. GCM10020058]|uniref:hypothetical protein n=1 Tax=Cohnella sp. GCM10020058 TaxID=3317330 RepID=UPI00362D39CA